MGLRSLLRNVFRSRASREAAETPETTDVRAEPTESPVVAPEPVHAPESVEAPEPVHVPEPVEELEPVHAPEPVEELEPVHAPEPVEALESVDAPEPVVIPESRGEFTTPAPAPAPIPVQAPPVAAEPVADVPAEPVAEPAEAVVEVEAPAEVPVEATAEATAVAAESEPAESVASEAEVDSATAPEPVVVAEAAPAPTSVATVPPARAEDVAPVVGARFEAAAAAVDKCGLAGRGVSVYLVLDRSGSMRSYYKDGTVQHLADQTLALSAQLGEATVPLVFFSTDIDGTADLDLTNHVGRIGELHGAYGHMGRTNYHCAIAKVVEHYRASGSTDPALVIFQTDGAPTSRPAAAKALCEAAGLPIFWQFVGFGDPEAKGFDFLRKLDELAVPEQRVVDNAGFFHAGQDPRLLSDAELYDQLLLEFPEWLGEARAAGVITTPVDALV
ncbi:VWA domain-containing protein [Embleya sp. NBC_00896]|uniref:VWA domain-containing protein n=1 Tax=Embleya sp. NBC_00896 TaxID=2975961 RepID=UPI003866C060|nr:VWA domain-containing protein [Embleya sp. NBC_00896]